MLIAGSIIALGVIGAIWLLIIAVCIYIAIKMDNIPE